MEFDNNLALVLGCLTHAKRALGPLDQLTLDKDYDAVQSVVKQVKDCIAGFSDEEIHKTHLFLLLNSVPAAQDENLLESELGHLLGIAPIISVDLLVVLSVEVISLHDFICNAITLMPLSVKYELTSSLIFLYVKNDFEKVAQELDMLCLAIYYNIFTSKCDTDFQMFFNLLETVLICILEHESTSNFFTYTCILKAVLLLLKSCLKKEIVFDDQKWQNFYTRPIVSDDHPFYNEDVVKKMVIEQACKICSNIPVRSKSKTCVKSIAGFDPVRDLAYECVAELKNLSPICDNLFNVLSSIARSPQDILNEIGECSLLSMCSNSLIENGNQHLWLQALIRHSDGLKDGEALKTLHKLVDLFDADDNKFVCRVFLNSPNLQTDNLSDLAVKCYSRLSMEDKLQMLEFRVKFCGSENFYFNENCESDILEVLNRLVANGGADCQEGQLVDQLMVLSYKSPQLLVKHVLLTAAFNKLFTTSVVPKVLQSLKAVFACPADIHFEAASLTDVTLLESIFNADEINKECEGLQNLVRLLFKEELINTEFFLRFCVFRPLFNSIKEQQDRTVILLLEILMDLQSEVPLWEKKISIPTLLVFLGQLLEWFSRSAVTEESEGIMIREIAVRNINKISTIPDCLESIQGAVKEWMLNELSVLSPANRHHFSFVFSEWMLFHGEVGNQTCVTLATVLPYLHVNEWHQLVKILPPACEENSPENSAKILTLCSAVKVIVRIGTTRTPANVQLNLRSCVRNLGSVIQSCLKTGFEPRHLPRVLGELLIVLEHFPKSDQFDIAVFLLPILFEIIDQGCGDVSTMAAFGKLILETSVQCVRRDLGRHLKRVWINFVNGNSSNSTAK